MIHLRNNTIKDLKHDVVALRKRREKLQDTLEHIESWAKESGLTIPASRSSRSKSSSPGSGDHRPTDSRSEATKLRQNSGNSRCIHCFKTIEGSPGKVIGCSADNCKALYHFSCAGITCEPRDGRWICPGCKLKTDQSGSSKSLTKEELDEKVAYLKHNIDTKWRPKVTKVEAEVLNRDKIIKTLKEEIAALKDHEETINKLKEDLIKVETTSEAIIAGLKARIRKFEKDLKERDEQIKSLEEETANNKDIFEAWKVEEEEKKVGEEYIKTEVEGLRHDRDELMKRLEEVKVSLIYQKQVKDKKVERMEKEIEELKKELDYVQDEKEHFEIEVNSIQEDKDELKGKVKDLEARIQQLMESKAVKVAETNDGVTQTMSSSPEVDLSSSSVIQTSVEPIESIIPTGQEEIKPKENADSDSGDDPHFEDALDSRPASG